MTKEREAEIRAIINAPVEDWKIHLAATDLLAEIDRLRDLVHDYRTNTEILGNEVVRLRDKLDTARGEALSNNDEIDRLRLVLSGIADADYACADDVCAASRVAREALEQN